MYTTVDYAKYLETLTKSIFWAVCVRVCCVCMCICVPAVVLNSSVSIACPGDTVTFMCITDTGALAWLGEENTFYNNHNFRMSFTLGIFRLTAGIVNGKLVSVATASGVKAEDDGVNITCADNINEGISTQTAILHIAGKLDFQMIRCFSDIIIV